MAAATRKEPIKVNCVSLRYLEETARPSRTPRRGKRTRGRSAVADIGIGVSIQRVAMRKAEAAHRDTFALPGSRSLASRMKKPRSEKAQLREKLWLEAHATA